MEPRPLPTPSTPVLCKGTIAAYVKAWEEAMESGSAPPPAPHPGQGRGEPEGRVDAPAPAYSNLARLLALHQRLSESSASLAEYTGDCSRT
jgi:hypothetical protein